MLRNFKSHCKQQCHFHTQIQTHMKKIKPEPAVTQEQESQVENCLSQEDDEEIVVDMIGAMDESCKVRECMVQLQQSVAVIDGNVIGNTFIITGPSQSGKASLVYWALRNHPAVHIVAIDCMLYRTELQFIQKLAKDVGQILAMKEIDKKIIYNENIKFGELNHIIQQQNQQFVFLIKNAEKLVEFKKQILLYNLLEWIADIKEFIGLAFITKHFQFVDRFEKRIKSRLNAKSLVLTRPDGRVIIQLLKKRIDVLLSQQNLHHKSHSKHQSVRVLVFERVMDAVENNKKLAGMIASQQEVVQRSIVFYLNSMKVALSQYLQGTDILRLHEQELKDDLCSKFSSGCLVVFPSLNRHLLANCTFPECIVMAVIHHMDVHKIHPYRFKTVYQIYLEMKQKFLDGHGVGSSFIYSKNIIERAVRRLQELKILYFRHTEESIWNSPIESQISCTDIKLALKSMTSPPDFLLQIIDS